MLTVARAAFVLLPTACLIVIAAFTARRSGEIDSLQLGCVEEDADGELWLSIWIEKALRDITRILVPASVQRAITVLEWLSADARERSGTRWLFQFDSVHQGGALTALHFRSALNEFAEYVGVPPLPDGTRWVFSPHQFRRFFSICYYWRWSFGSLTALSTFLRQFDLEVTRRYVTEVSRGELVRLKEDALADHAVRVAAAQELSGLDGRRRAHHDVSREHRTMVARDVVAGRTALGGFGGEQITKRLDDLIIEFERRLEIRPASSPQGLLNELLSGFVAHTLTHLEPNPLGHSLCKCARSRADLAAARCLDEFQATHPDTPRPAQPDHAHASDTVCGGCAHNVLPPETEPYWIEAIAKTDGVAASTPAAHLRTVATKRATALRAIHKRGFQDVKRVARPITLEEPNADDA
ncbi:site-specific integrase [Azospirillum argentinense]|nr:site-specific integrase [Azospirillum argentinense]